MADVKRTQNGRESKRSRSTTVQAPFVDAKLAHMASCRRARPGARQDLIDPLSSKTATIRNLTNVLNVYDGNGQKLIEDLKAKYLKTERGRFLIPEEYGEAFDNVSHASVLENLRKAGCGSKTYGYIKYFLTKRTATIRIGEEWSEPVEPGDRGTPQRSVLSPLLFNLALLTLPELLNQIEGVDQAFFADDITVWTNHAGSDAWAEEALQRAATAVHENLSFMVQPGRPKKQPPPNVIITIDGTEIKPTPQIRILDLLLRSDGKAHAAVNKIKTTSQHILSMIRIVTNRSRGIKEDTLRLVQAFVLSRLTYSAPYLQLTKANCETLNTTISKAVKLAMGMPKYSSAQKLLDMGSHNTAEELVESHLFNQRMRLSRTEHGRAVLSKIGW
ncbi:uncharacterized protein LOC144155286 [Haemaphysalis longicornis]